MPMLTIQNQGQAIVQTNYFDMEQARKGFFYLSWNAGAGRLLVPDAHIGLIPDMAAAEYVIVSRGPWRAQGNRDALELVFEDRSDSPFAIQLMAEQTDRLLPEQSQGGGFVILLQTRQGTHATLPGRYRVVPEIPCMEPWCAH